jgi:hypothetical protein
MFRDATSAVSKIGHHDETLFVFSEAAERQEVTQRRPRGDYRPIAAADLWENVRRGTVRDFQATLQPLQQLRHEGLPPTPRKGTGHIARTQAQADARAPDTRPGTKRFRLCKGPSWLSSGL